MTENRISGIRERLEIILMKRKREKIRTIIGKERIINVPGAKNTTDVGEIRYIRK